ncbi:hypothetical protein AWC38_SpisGene11140 [Stylophora pistillata]|uniref:Uncharacterized protein n=1 Tax=Stylophora pistillata TaxID=50429 RepID=A0A2B4S6T7_STYPI|nr:hypothetical protein AWC38_SpisGene11140 [Stylophora pistillata]
MVKRRNCSGFLIDSLRQEVENEVQQETFSWKIIADISKIDLHFLDNVSEDVIIFGLLLKFGMAFVSSVAGAMECPSFRFPSPGLNEKRVANAFWNGELEAELRERKALDMFSMMFVDADREAIMVHIDKLRAKANYLHSPEDCTEDCTEDCKARGDQWQCKLFPLAHVSNLVLVYLIWLYVLERQSNPCAVIPPPDVDGFSNNEEAFAKSSIQPGYGSSKDANDVI